MSETSPVPRPAGIVQIDLVQTSAVARIPTPRAQPRQAPVRRVARAWRADVTLNRWFLRGPDRIEDVCRA